MRIETIFFKKLNLRYTKARKEMRFSRRLLGAHARKHRIIFSDSRANPDEDVFVCEYKNANLRARKKGSNTHWRELKVWGRSKA
jgi:hypothetical protein